MKSRPVMNICARPCAALLTFEPWRSDGAVPANSWKLRKYVWVRFVEAQDGSSPTKRINVISQAQIPCVNIPPKKVLNAYGSIIGRA